jgi:uncharacterized membrane protein
MLTSAGYRADNHPDLEFNVMWDGVFHISTYIFTATGMAILWRKALQTHAPRSGKVLVGAILMGFGIINLVEGLIDHHFLGIHHVNETVSPEQWIFWDVGFLIWGALRLVGGWLLWRAGKRETAMTTGRASQQLFITFFSSLRF